MFLTTDYLVVCRDSDKFQRCPMFLKLWRTTKLMHSQAHATKAEIT
jgi:hypothetical protein